MSSNEPDIERAEQQSATELGIQRERAEASGEGESYSEASEAMIDSVQASSDADEAEFLYAQGEGTVGDDDVSDTGPLFAEVDTDSPEYREAQAKIEAELAEGEDEKIDIGTLPELEARAVLFEGVVEAHNRLTVLEQRMNVIAQVLAQILDQAAAQAQPQVEVAKTMPKMATKIKPR